MIPVFIGVEIQKPEKLKTRFWIPIFLLWFLILWIMFEFWKATLLLLALLFLALTLTSKAKSFVASSKAFIELVSALRGTRIFLKSKKRSLRIQIY